MHKLLGYATAAFTFGVLLGLAGAVGLFLGNESMVPRDVNITMTTLGIMLGIGGAGTAAVSIHAVGTDR